MTKRLVLISLSFVITFAMFIFTLIISTNTAHATSLIALSSVQAGDLIRGQSFSAVYYYGKDGFRYVFPNDKTYFTWYTNFDSVKWISDADMTKIQIGGNVTYKPGSRMIKINSDPKVYAVGAGGTLRAIASETVAKDLYGANWNKQIDDVPDGFFSNYKMGGGLELAISFSVTGEKADAESIDVDKKLKSATVVMITDSGYSPSNVTVKAGTALQFKNTGSAKHTASDDAGNWGTGTLNAGENFSRYFKEAGTFSFHDAYNANLKGSAMVE